MNNYDSDDGVRRSPGLERIDYKYTPRLSPLPIAPRRRRGSSPKRSRSVVSPGGQKDRRRGRKKNKVNQGDVVLVRHLDPNRPDLAEEAGQRPLYSDSDPDFGENSDTTDNDLEMDKRLKMGDEPGPSQSISIAPDDKGNTERTRPIPNSLHLEKPGATLPMITPHPPSRSSMVDGDTSQKPATRSTENSNTIATSPTLRPHLIEPFQRPIGQQLAAFNAETKSPSSGSNASPSSKEPVLPPIGTLMQAVSEDRQTSMSHEPMSAVLRANTLPSGELRSPYPRCFENPRQRKRSEPFPSGPPGRAPPARGHQSILPNPPATYQMDPRKGTIHLSNTSSTSPAMTRNSTGSQISQTPPDSATDDFSPSSNTTGAEASHATESTRSTIPASSPPPGMPSSGPPGGYRCTHEGCNAAPFQTQYLLNSHANVHSQDRPHYCPVQGCNRSEGGKGFKRKNEMIRHGLVHNSPGYVCPYCADKEHKYPRPDNLQRHVRMHHEDMDKDDPVLRDVLAMRTAGGSNRGGRRRI